MEKPLKQRRSFAFVTGAVFATAALACGNPQIDNSGSNGGGNSGNGSGGSTSVGRAGSNGSGSGGSGMGAPSFELPDASSTPPPASNKPDASCGFQDYMLERRPAELLMVLDRSGSMREPANFMTLTSKWDETVPALNETIMKTAATVSWGMKMFPVGLVACSTTDGVDVPIAANNAPMMLATIAGTMPLGNGTPTRYAIQKAVAHLKATPTNTPRYILLATDGEPNCADGMTNALVDPDGAVEAIRMAAADGFKTFVIGIATQFGDANMTLNRMAEAGGEPRMGDPRYYPVASRAELVNALSLITGKVADCVFPLDKLPPSPNDVAVDVNGMRVNRDPTKMNGWDYTANNMAIQIHGPACEAIKNANAQVKITFGCPGVLIP
jgi:von Willebrand factor type A domain